jgi:hypothetical protein
MKAHGRPILGGIAGFFFFLFVGLDLLAFGVLPLNSPLLTVLPVLGIAIGIAWAYWAPFGGRGNATTMMASPPAPPAPPSGTTTF